MATSATLESRPVNTFPNKLKQPLKFYGEKNFKVVESWVFYIDNYFTLSSILDENVKACPETILLFKTATVRLYKKAYPLVALKWTNLKQNI